MAVILLCAALAWALIGFSPDTVLGRALRRLLVERPAALLAELRFVRLIWLAAIVGLIWGLVAIAREEAPFLLAQGLPEVTGWLLALDGASVMDGLALAFILTAGVGLKATRAAASAVARRIGTRVSRARRTPRRPRKPQDPANEDEPAGFALAA